MAVYTDGVSSFSVYQYVLVDEDLKDYLQVLEVAKAYACEGDCYINPVVYEKAELGRKKIFPGIEGTKIPDLTTIYGYVDVKSPVKMPNVVRNANKAVKQSAIVAVTTLVMEDEISAKEIGLFNQKIFQDKHYTQNEGEVVFL